MYIAVDFDGTCVESAFPEVGREIGAACVLKYLADHGHKILLNTMRSNTNVHNNAHYLDDAVNWFNTNGIPLYGVNENPDNNFSNSPKVHADLYIDDLSLGIPLVNDEYVDWLKCVDLLMDKGLIKRSDYSKLKFGVFATVDKL